MFTGLIQTMGSVVELRDDGPGCRLTVEAADVVSRCAVGDSVSINGCCLTVVYQTADAMVFEAGPETLSKTNLGQLQSGSQVNLETSLRVGDTLGGHFVTGHVDGVGTLDQRDDNAEWSTCWFRVPVELTRQMVCKGSVGVDGVSLTLVDVEADRFSVQLIPHTLSITTLGRLAIGDRVNIETDVLAKYAQKAVMPKGDES